MSRQHHQLKCETVFYKQIEAGNKTFELRVNDRNFTKGDMVALAETVNGEYTGRKLDPFEIKYILYGGRFGLPETHCIFNW